MTHLVVKSHRPLQFALAIILLSMLCAIATWAMLDNIHWSFIFGRLDANEQRKELEAANRALERENAALHQRVVALQSDTHLDNQTSALLQDEIRELQEEIFRLKGELQFYQGVMEATGEGKGLDVQGIYVRRLSQPNSYRVKLILTHVSSGDEPAAGMMDITVEGIKGGITRVVNLKDVTLDEDLDLSFKFRNFKRFESNLKFPEGFSPQRVFVELQPSDEKETKINRVFDWPKSAA